MQLTASEIFMYHSVLTSHLVLNVVRIRLIFIVQIYNVGFCLHRFLRNIETLLRKQHSPDSFFIGIHDLHSDKHHPTDVNDFRLSAWQLLNFSFDIIQLLYIVIIFPVLLQFVHSLRRRIGGDCTAMPDNLPS